MTILEAVDKVEKFMDENNLVQVPTREKAENMGRQDIANILRITNVRQAIEVLDKKSKHTKLEKYILAHFPKIGEIKEVKRIVVVDWAVENDLNIKMKHIVNAFKNLGIKVI